MTAMQEWKEETERFLKSCGRDTLEGLRIYKSAERFWLASLFCAVLWGGIGAEFHAILCLAGILAGGALPAGLLFFSNRRDNRQIGKELLWLYETIVVQLEAGMQIQEALSESGGMIRNARLKKALCRLSGRLIYGEDVSDALREFEDSFRNPYITSFCMILSQLGESGYAVRLLKDIRLQMEEMERMALAGKRDMLGMQLELFQLLLFSGILALIMYGCIVSLLGKLPVI